MLPGVVWAAIGCGALWSGAVTWLRTRGTRRKVQSADPVPAAVLAALRAASNPSDPSVLNTTVLELAERGVITIEPADSTHPALLHSAAVPAADTLPPYQVAVVSRLLHRQGATGRPLPLSALQSVEDPTARAWYASFLHEVRIEAAKRGLYRPVLPAVLKAPLLLLGLGASAVIAVATSHYEPAHTGVPFIVMAGSAIATWATLRWSTRMRVTPTGHRLLTSGHEPESTTHADLLLRNQPALPAVAPDPQAGVKVLPNQLQPLPPHLVWSDYGGAWHPLNQSSQESYTYGSTSPVRTLPLVAFVCIGGIVSTAHSTHGHSTALVVFGALPVLILAGAAVNPLRRRKLPKRAVLVGQVAKLWSAKRGGEDNSEFFYCTLDVGRGPESVRLTVGKSIFQRMRVGMEVEVLVSPRTKRIKNIRHPGGFGGAIG